MSPRVGRRFFLQGVSAAALAGLLPTKAVAQTKAIAMGGAGPAANATPGQSLSKRSVVNVNFLDYVYDYPFINHVVVSSLGVAPVSGYGVGGPVWNSTILDGNGWPNSSTSGKQWGGHILLPASTSYSSYVITWDGEGQLQFTSGNWTAVGGTGYVINGPGIYSGASPRIQVFYSGPRQQIGWRVLQTNQTGKGYFRNLRIFRTEDETDLRAGMVFRRGYKNMLVALDPSAIRFMNWTGGNDAQPCRFEHRARPNYATYGANPTISLPYGETTGTNLYTLAAVSGMPRAMQHGEIVQTRIGNGMVRAGAKPVAGITKSNPGIVSCAAHGFATGDTVVHRIPSGMTQLDYWPVKVSVIDANHYSIGVDTSGFTAFSSGTAMEYISLNVGQRGEFPVVFTDGVTPGSAYSNNYINSGDYKTFFFDKTLSASKDASGRPIYGVWMFSTPAPQGYLPYAAGVPLEICTALIRELNALNPKWPIHMWVTIPHRAMLSMDPDYVASSNYAVGAVNVILNGANGYGGLPTNCNLFVEYSNETWNFGGGFTQTSYLARRGYLRDSTVGTANTSYMMQLRSVIMVEDIKAAIGSNSRVKFVLSGQGTVGIATGSTNYNRAFGTTQFSRDPLNIWGQSPISHHDCWAWAGYFSAGPSYDSANLATLAAAFASQTDPAAREAICATYVNNGIIGSGYSETIATYQNLRLPAYASTFGALGKSTIMYEGGWDRAVSGSTAQINNFLAAVKQSRAWATALKGFFDAFNSTPSAFMPADYVQVDERWGHAYPDTYGNSSVEGAALDSAWLAVAARNQVSN